MGSNFVAQLFPKIGSFRNQSYPKSCTFSEPKKANIWTFVKKYSIFTSILELEEVIPEFIPRSPLSQLYVEQKFLDSLVTSQKIWVVLYM
jgi:hypothetical protein